MYDILKPALATYLGSAAVRESLTLAEPPLFADAKAIIAKIGIKCYNFCGFLGDRVLVMESTINNSPISKGYW